MRDWNPEWGKRVLLLSVCFLSVTVVAQPCMDLSPAVTVNSWRSWVQFAAFPHLQNQCGLATQRSEHHQLARPLFGGLNPAQGVLPGFPGSGASRAASTQV